MTSPLTLKSEITALGIFGGRIALSELILFSIFLTDILMLGLISELSLSAALLVNSSFVLCFVTSLGFLQGAIPLASSHWEQRQLAAFYSVSKTSILMAAIISALVMTGFLLYVPVLNHIGYDQQLTTEIWNYLQFIIPGLGMALVYIAVRNAVIATGNSRGFLTLALIALISNAGLNYALGFGLAIGAITTPAMGIAGIGLASSLVELFLLIGFLRLLRATGFRVMTTVGDSTAKFWAGFREQLSKLARLGTPIGVIFFVDTTLFSGVLIIVGRHDVLGMAALALIFEWVALAVMVPVGLSEALVQRVSRAKAAGQIKTQLPLLVRAACIIALGYIGILALVQFGIGINIPALFLVDPSAHPHLVQLLNDFAVYGFALAAMNAFIIIIAGILRGLLDVITSMFIVMISYWVVGIGLTTLFMEIFDLGVSFALLAVTIAVTLATIAIVVRLSLLLRMTRT